MCMYIHYMSLLSYGSYFSWCSLLAHLLLSLQDGVILGADTRATEGTVVADKNCSKIHYMAKNI